jgi:glyoxylase-like metal-dependent hydrolase (beta-lactamase superfamily II)
MTRRELLAGAPLLAAPTQAAAGAVERWSVITIGNLSRNEYWGEPNDKAFRDVLCTTTLIAGKGFRLLVDPSVASPEGMAKELNRRTGLKLDDITAIFITHEHADHVAGLANFPKQPWYTSALTAEVLNRGNQFPKKLEVTPDLLFDAVEPIATPGHTRSHYSLRFQCDGKRIVVAGDAVATLDFWRDRRNFYNAVDPAQGTRTMDAIAKMADIIVPGHDNYYLV